MTRLNYDPKYVQNFYDQDPEREWQRLVRSPLEEIKFHVHDHYIRTHLSNGMRVLEVGAGPGRFTKTLHDIGCSIVVADISAGQLEANKRKAEELGFAASVERWIQTDICNMEDVETEAFDAVVAYGGPLSYVFEKAGDALNECSRVLKPKGFLLASVMSLWGTLHQFFGAIAQLPVDNNREIIRTGNLTPETNPDSDHYCHLFRADELRRLVEDCGFKIIALSASNAVSSQHEEALQTLRDDKEAWDALLAWELEASVSSGLVEVGSHTIVVAQQL